MNFKQLFQGAIRVSPSRKDPPNSSYRKIVSITPYPTTNSVLMQFILGGITVQGEHQVNIFWKGLEVTKDKRSAQTHLVAGDYFVEKPDLGLTEVKVRCTCVDFYFTFSFWNYGKGSLFGKKPREYKRKTLHYPPRNPGKHPGVCKHCLNSVFLLQTNRWAKRNL